MIDYSECSKSQMAEALEHFAYVSLHHKWPFRIDFTEEEIYNELKDEYLPIHLIEEE